MRMRRKQQQIFKHSLCACAAQNPIGLISAYQRNLHTVLGRRDLLPPSTPIRLP